MPNQNGIFFLPNMYRVSFPKKGNKAVPLTCHLAMCLCQRKLTGDKRDTSHLLKIKVCVFTGFAWNQRALQISSQTLWKRIYCLKSLDSNSRMLYFVSWRRSKLQQEWVETFFGLIRFCWKKRSRLFHVAPFWWPIRSWIKTICYKFLDSGSLRLFR